MTKEAKQELRYYVPLCMGFIIIMIALLVPPVGVIPTSALYGGGIFLCLCAAIVGLDIPSILHEINEMKRLALQTFNQNENNN